MGAVFYNYSGGMFKATVGSGAGPITTDLFSGLVSSSNMCILTEISIKNNDVLQFFMTFDDFIHYYYFGKGVGSISINGMLFMDCNGSFPGMAAIYGAIGSARGSLITVSAGGFTFQGVLMDCVMNVMAEPETIASFAANFAMVNHSLPSPQFQGGCNV